MTESAGPPPDTLNTLSGRWVVFLTGLSLGGFTHVLIAYDRSSTEPVVQPMSLEAPAMQAASRLEGYALDAGDRVQWKLPNRLREISGLATASGDRVFAHNDERAVIYEVDVREGRLIKGFALGDPPVRGDFEGLAIMDNRFFLVTSEGVLYESREGVDGERLDYNTYGTGVGRWCEVEGLAVAPSEHHLLLICKTPRVDSLINRVAIFKWSLDERQLNGDDAIMFPLTSFTGTIGEREFRASGMGALSGSDHYLIVAARQHAIAEVTLDGRVWHVRHLDRDIHRQTEGMTVLSDGTIVLADEGASRRGRLTLYGPG